MEVLNWNIIKKISSEDEELRQEIDKIFSLRTERYDAIGFDGKFQYIFVITSNLESHGNKPEENKNIKQL